MSYKGKGLFNEAVNEFKEILNITPEDKEAKFQLEDTLKKTS